MRMRYCGSTNVFFMICRVRRFLRTPYYGELCPPVHQHGRTRRPIRLSRTLQKPSYVYTTPLPVAIISFVLLTIPLSTWTDIEWRYGERKLLTEHKPLLPSSAQCLRCAAAIRRNCPFSAMTASSAGISEETAIDPRLTRI